MSTAGGPLAADELAAVVTALGRPLDAILWYADFACPPPLRELDAVHRAGAIPVTTWEPWLWADPTTPVMGALRTGHHDEHVRKWAAALGGHGRPVWLRFAHEFNGHWYPWSPAGGTDPSAYLAAWRRIHDIFIDEGATNVRWMWSPNVVLSDGAALADWYPGRDYVDLIGVDGYNWGTSRQWSHWVQPRELCSDTVSRVRELADDLPVLVSEVGCAESGGDKPAWITAFVDWLTDSEVDGFIWFEHDKETDWRIASTPAAAAAMAAALR